MNLNYLPYQVFTQNPSQPFIDLIITNSLKKESDAIDQFI